MIIATVVKNEMAKYLPSAVDQWRKWGTVVAVDNGSDDGSFELLEANCARVQVVEPALWGQENIVRAELYTLAMQTASDDEWVLWMEADMTMSADPNDLDYPEADAVAMRWHDLWSPSLARFDQLWRAHQYHRTWMVRKNPNWRVSISRLVESTWVRSRLVIRRSTRWLRPALMR